MVNLYYFILMLFCCTECSYGKYSGFHMLHLENNINQGIAKDILMVENDNFGQPSYSEICDAIVNNNLNKCNYFISKGISPFFRNCETGICTLHVASTSCNSNLIEFFLYKFEEKIQKINDRNFFEPNSIQKWINIEDFSGLTPLDYAKYNKYNLKGVFKTLKSLKAKHGSGIKLVDKLKKEKYYFKIFEELRFCLYSNDMNTAIRSINYLEKNEKKIFFSLFKYWIPHKVTDNIFIPNVIISTISSYFGSWHDLKINERRNCILDEVIYVKGKDNRLYDAMVNIGCKNSDTYIEYELLNNFLRIQNYKMYRTVLKSFFLQDNSMRYIGGSLGIFNDFIKKAMDLGDFETISLFLDHSKVFIDKDVKDLISYAEKIIQDHSFANLFINISKSKIDHH